MRPPPRLGMTRLLLLVSLLLGSVASAASEAAWVAVLRTSAPEDAELVTRVRGQLSDLAVALRVRPAPAPGASFEAQWRAAEALAHADAARVVLWFSRAPGVLSVHLADLAEQRLLVRELPVAPGRRGRSAAAEAAALIVRSALSALAEGIPVGESIASRRAPSLRPHRALPLPPSAEPPLLGSAVTHIPPTPSGRWLLSLGWQAALDGYSPVGQQGVQVGLGWEDASWHFRSRLLASLPAQLPDAFTRLSLSRHALGVEVERALLRSRHWRLGAGVGVGLTGFLRTTTALVPDVAATAPRLTLVPSGAPTLSLRWRGGPVPLEASLALDVLAGVPTFVYQIGEENLMLRNRLWGVQPRLGLAVLLDPP